MAIGLEQVRPFLRESTARAPLSVRRAKGNLGLLSLTPLDFTPNPLAPPLLRLRSLLHTGLG